MEDFEFTWIPTRRKELSDKNAARTALDYAKTKIQQGDFATELMDAICNSPDFEEGLSFGCMVNLDIRIVCKDDDFDPVICFDLPRAIYQALADCEVIRRTDHRVTTGYTMKLIQWQPQETERVVVTVKAASDD